MTFAAYVVVRHIHMLESVLSDYIPVHYTDVRLIFIYIQTRSLLTLNQDLNVSCPRDAGTVADLSTEQLSGFTTQNNPMIFDGSDSL